MDRTEFMNVVYDELQSDADNNRANRIIDAADEYAESMKPRWIPITERLPEDGEIVLVLDGIDCAVAFLRSDADAWDDPLHGWLDSFEFDVKAWMPLPEPYREEAE